VLPSQQKPAFIDLWIVHQFDVTSLAYHSHVAESVINAMMSSQPVARADAETVLHHLSERYSTDYSLETVHIVLRRSFANKSEVARLLQQIDDEYTASHAALHSLASGSSRHEVITRKMEYMGAKIQELGNGYNDAIIMDALLDWSSQWANSIEQTTPPN